MELVNELNKLSPEEFEKVISQLLKEDRGKALLLSKAIGKAMEKEIKEEKLKTEMAIAQSRIYTLTRDVEEIVILKDAVEYVLGAKFYKNPEESEGVRRIAEEFEIGAPQLGADLKRLLSPFSTTEAMDWVFKMLRNQTVVVNRQIGEDDIITEEYPIAVSKPFVYKDEGIEARTYYLGILVSEQGRKAHFVPVYTITLRTTPEMDDYQVYFEDKEISSLAIDEIIELQETLPKTGYPLTEFDDEVAKQIKRDLASKLVDKYVFFNKAIPSSKLNEELRRFLKEHGFFTPRKNQSVFIADKDEKEALFFSQVKYFRAIVKVLHDVYAETKRLIKDNKKRYSLPSLEKQLSLSRQILIEEVALLSKEQIVEQLKERFEIHLEKLREMVAKDESYDKLKNQDWFKELELIPRKIDIDAQKVREYKFLKRKLILQSTYNAIMKTLSWEKPQVKKFNKALSILEKTPSEEKRDLYLSVKEPIRKALTELIKSVKTTKEITSLVSSLVMHKELLSDYENEITEFAKKIYTVNPSLSKSLAKAFNIPEDKYKPVGIGIFRRKFR